LEVRISRYDAEIINIKKVLESLYVELHECKREMECQRQSYSKQDTPIRAMCGSESSGQSRSGP
jgi:hypothetical protein